MDIILQLVATLSTTFFAGAAIYISAVEHPARMGCDTRTAATVWAPSYRRATFMQAPLAILGFVGGVALCLLGDGTAWLVGALCIGSVVPITLLVIMPTNRQLLAPGRDLASSETRVLLERWGRLHAIRTVLSFVAAVVYVALMTGG